MISSSVSFVYGCPYWKFHVSALKQPLQWWRQSDTNRQTRTPGPLAISFFWLFRNTSFRLPPSVVDNNSFVKIWLFCAPCAPRLLSISSIAYNYMLLKPKKPPPGDRSTTEATASILGSIMNVGVCWKKHTSNILFVVIKYIYKKPPKCILPTKV